MEREAELYVAEQTGWGRPVGPCSPERQERATPATGTSHRRAIDRTRRSARSVNANRSGRPSVAVMRSASRSDRCPDDSSARSRRSGHSGRAQDKGKSPRGVQRCRDDLTDCGKSHCGTRICGAVVRAALACSAGEHGAFSPHCNIDATVSAVGSADRGSPSSRPVPRRRLGRARRVRRRGLRSTLAAGRVAVDLAAAADPGLDEEAFRPAGRTRRRVLR